jgi:D-tagatose-1,6-bisphosphate aldolase subunit GatZ/KbaZ
MQHRLLQYFSSAQLRKPVEPIGIYAVCSAHRWVVRAAAEQAVADNSLLLIEATSNQVNQFGGYTGMRPAAFRTFVTKIVAEAGLPLERLVLGGDHLGPNPWRKLPVEEAMGHACVMVAEYVAAGFSKIHLDASMPCAGDPVPLVDEQVAVRAVQLAQAAEAAYVARGASGSELVDAPVYVIGTEVPTPGGATHPLDGIEATSATAAARTWAVHAKAFAGEPAAWARVLAMVVQPGVEFGHAAVALYDRKSASELVAWRSHELTGVLLEAHSTDYQLARCYPELVADGFAILKVGPALTFAMREALFALESIEAVLVPKSERSKLAATIEQCMLSEPENWLGHYPGDASQQKLLRQYSYSDRMRYYWNNPAVAVRVDQLIANLRQQAVPEVLLSQYLPAQYVRTREGRLDSDPIAWIVDKVRDVLRIYATGCGYPIV